MRNHSVTQIIKQKYFFNMTGITMNPPAAGRFNGKSQKINTQITNMAWLAAG